MTKRKCSSCPLKLEPLAMVSHEPKCIAAAKKIRDKAKQQPNRKKRGFGLGKKSQRA